MFQSTAIKNRWTAFGDLVLIVAVLIASKSLLLNIDAVWAYAGPISLLLTLAVATWRLRKSGERWADLGMKRPRSFARLVIYTLIALVVTMGVGILVQSLAINFIGGPDEATQAIDARHQGRFDNLPGNLQVYLFWLAMAWIIGGFAEEMIFRAALFSRFERLFAGFPLAVVFAILFPAILFGQQHYYYQGLAGWIATGAIGVTSGVLYLVFKRNLWPLILSHGLNNTIGLTLLYLGLMG